MRGVHVSQPFGIYFGQRRQHQGGGGVVLDKEGAGPRKGKAYIYMPLLPEEMYINGVHAESDKNKHEKYT